MKFTEKEAFDELKRQLKQIVGDPAINDKAITETVATLLPLVANDETELTEFAVKVLPVLKTGDGNARKYASNAVKKREKELLQEPETETPVPQGAAAQPPKGGEPEGEYAKLLARVEALEKEKKDAEAAAAVEVKRKAIAKALETKGVKDASWVEGLLAEVTVNGDTDAEAAAEKYLKLYNRVNADTPAGVTPGAAGGSGGEKNPFADISAAAKARREAEKGTITTN